VKDFTPFARYLTRRTRSLGDLVLHRLVAWGVDETVLLLALATLVGSVVGGAILLFYRGIDLAALVVPGITARLGVPIELAAIATLVLGLVMVRIIVHFGTRDSPGENIPDVMHAVARRGGVLHSMPVTLKTLAAAVTLGSGGSVGAEGPVAVLGSALGSRIGRYFRFRPNRLKLLVGCGAAAGISGAFGAPIAGVFFALEEIIGGFRTMALAPVVVASVAAAAVTRIGLGDDLVITIPQEYTIGPTSDLFLYALLGLAGGFVAVAYNRGVWKIHDLLEDVPGWLKLLFAAVVIGAVSSQFEGSGPVRLGADCVGALEDRLDRAHAGWWRRGRGLHARPRHRGHLRLRGGHRPGRPVPATRHRAGGLRPRGDGGPGRRGDPRPPHGHLHGPGNDQ
jgi:H+/Cl- antiporter ClcA